jgi:hypothetical protein
MQDKKSVGFPNLIEHPEFESTRPMALHELPKPMRIDHEMNIVRAYHPRIAAAIEVFWGHRDCVEYLQKLITNGGDGFGNARVGFKHEVLSALINLTTLHEIKPR